MSELALYGDPFRHVATRELVTPLIDSFYPAMRAGRENSVVLREQGLAVPPAPVSSSDSGQGLPADFLAACREAVSFAQQLPAGRVQAPSAELLALAKRAVEQQLARKDEDVQSWAEQLARDGGKATD
jgi:hypothetical protein